jgi:molybdopterin-containing oxidoreductase family molybdopterin binding subunit
VVIHTPANFLLGGYGDTEVVERFYKSVPFVVGFAVEPHETHELDDLVLPCPTFLERSDFAPNTNYLLGPAGDSEFYWQIRQRVVEPPPEVHAAQELFLELASRLGFLGDFHTILNRMYHLKPPHMLEADRRYAQEEIYDHMAQSWFGTDRGWDWFKEHGVLTIPKGVDEAYPGPFIPARIPVYLENFISRGNQLREVLGEMDLSWDLSDYRAVPQWQPCDAFEKVQEGQYDLMAVHYKLAFVYGTYGNANPWIDEFCQRTPYTYTILINADAAQRKGIKDGDLVWLESPVCKVRAQAKVTQCIHPEVVGVAGHFGHWAEGSPIQKGKGVSFNSLLPYDMDHLDKISTSLDHCVPVKVYL